MKTPKTPKPDSLWKISSTVAISSWKRGQTFICAFLLVSSTLTTKAATRFVNIANPAPIAPYTNWATAATTIQSAVDAALAGDIILVTNGVYQTGARAVDRLNNRVAVTKPVTVQSVNGPSVTAIIGYRDPGTTNGDAAVRCVYLANGAVLSGFTLTNGATQTYGNYSTNRSGGGVFCETAGAIVTNCVLTGNTSSQEGGGAYQGMLNNCTLIGNSVMDQNGQGGGAYSAILNNCTLVGNRAVASWNGSGGGSSFCTLNNCTLRENVADNGGGAYGSTLNNCTLTDNTAEMGGGACGAKLNYCILNGNSALEYGGGAISSRFNSCLIANNFADFGGGVSGHYFHGPSVLTNCTLVGNSARQGGGANDSELKNCILYYNTALIGYNHYDSLLDFCCATPLPPTGIGNINIEPGLASFSHLGENSPCRGAGSAAYASGGDLDGEAWANPPSIGCDELWKGSATGALSVSLLAAHTNGVASSQFNFQAAIKGRLTSSVWDFGDGIIVSNKPSVSHAWAAAGSYLVILTAYNDTYPSGLSSTVTVHVAAQPVHYVSQGNTTSVAPYTSWETAATNIQDAVDAAVPGSLIVVSNGVYKAGARAIYGSSNRVAITKPMTLQSVNGPSVTMIVGNKISSGGNGAAPVRGVYLAEGAILSGFTLTNGSASLSGNDETNRSGGGVWCESVASIITNCVLIGNQAYGGGGAFRGTLLNCTLADNLAAFGGGGGASFAILKNCVLTANSIPGTGYGGGASRSELTDCLLTENTATGGGGAYDSVLARCIITKNSAQGSGGGIYMGALSNCKLTRNWASFDGGGAREAILNNCLLTENIAEKNGGAATDATLYNCTVVGNDAKWGAGGGTYMTWLNNCIVYHNKARVQGDNYDNSGFSGMIKYTCTTPLPNSGVGNITDEPALASLSRLSESSPCRHSGNSIYAVGTDLDEESWSPTPSMGCDEYWSGSLTGELNVAIAGGETTVTANIPLTFKALIEGKLVFSRWDFGDGVVVSNLPIASHTWEAPGDYMVTLTAYNETYPSGVSATSTVHIVSQQIHYVSLENMTPSPPYSSWETAATNIQDAVDAAPPGSLVLVTNGIYAVGSRIVYGASNRLAITKMITVQSVNGPSVTTIAGEKTFQAVNPPQGVRCVYLTNGAVLSGFTLTNGAAQSSGGGVWCESRSAIVTNCVLTGNAARDTGGGSFSGTLLDCTFTYNTAREGGGADSGALDRCTLNGNSATYDGGGVLNCSVSSSFLFENSAANSGGGSSKGTLVNCTIVGNWSSLHAGGVDNSVLTNCIVYYNRARLSEPNFSSSVGFSSELNYCCTFPMPIRGVGNITNEPALASASHLSAWSPCRNAGSLADATNQDIDGEVWSNPPSIGCDEYSNGSVTGTVSVAIIANYTNVAVGFTVGFKALIAGRVSASKWDFGQGTVVSNQPYATHAWGAAGDYPVELRAYNESHPDGLAVTVTVRVVDPPTHYVALNNTNAVPPYGSWATAATNIQDAVDAAVIPGAIVIVTNGVYRNGERYSYLTTSRVTVDKPVVVQSVNGPLATEIRGFTQSPDQLRCVYLADGAILSGFTLTQGWGDFGPGSQSGGGAVFCESVKAIVTNCVLRGNSSSDGGGTFSGTLNYCILTSNSASSRGGGACFSTLNNCAISYNSSRFGGGGVDNCTVYDCTLTNNNSSAWGGGALDSTLNSCLLLNNSAYFGGGGADGGLLNDCTLTGNSVRSYGGGASRATLNNCTVTSNRCSLEINGYASVGGGVYLCNLNNCTVANNTARQGGGAFADKNRTLNNCVLKANWASDGGAGAFSCILNNCVLVGNSGEGASFSVLRNCISYYNTAANHEGCTIETSCTTPLPAGTGSIDDAPLFMSMSGWSDLRLQTNSPCINAGNNVYAFGSTDLEGRPRIQAGVVDMGPYESPIGIIITAHPTDQKALPGQTVTFTLSARVTAPLDYFWQRNGTFIPGATNASYSATNVQLSDSGSQISCVVSNIYGQQASSKATLLVLSPVYYVAQASANPVPPYTNWATAATNIQDALGAAVLPGSLVLVSNGVYQVGATAVYGMSNRVAVTRALTVKSVNGPSVTTIVGYQVPGTTNGSSAVRCVYLTNGAALSGFTLTNGATQASGDLFKNESGGGVWCESASAVVSNCVLTGNAAYYSGGGTHYGTFNNCTLTRNSANRGGGAYFSTLNNCVMRGNAAIGSSGAGGGAYNGTVNNCALTGNSASSSGGGSYSGTLNNCTVAGNSAIFGGGAYNGTLTNCIVYYNTASSGANFSGGAFDHCCTAPTATGVGNLTNAPLFVDTNGWNTLQLRAGSFCINAGNNASATGATDIDGNPRIVGGNVDIGAYEFQNAPWIVRQPTNQIVVVGGIANFSVAVSGAEPLAYFWQRDGAFVPGATNAAYVTTSVQLSDSGTQFSCLVSNAYGASLSSNAVLTVVMQPVHYVSLASTNPVAPYTNWATAASNIQDALGAAVLPGSLVLVSNGVYQAGATPVYGMSNRVAITRAVTVKSLNGPEVTTISGSGPKGPSAVRCAYLTNGAVLSGFTLTNGATQTSGDSKTRQSGGGVWCESASAVVTNCVLAGNSAYYYGGGAYNGTLDNCALMGNSATGTGASGGGAYTASLNNCTLSGNSASLNGGGTYSGTLTNCMLTANSASWSGGGAYSGSLNNSTLMGNSSAQYGGGASDASLNNCILAGNSAQDGGGVYSANLTNCTLVNNSATDPTFGTGGGAQSSTLKNCIVYYNTAPFAGANYYSSTLDYCCTTPLPSGRTNNVATEPRFLSTNGWNNLRLQSNSPCINVGNNSYAFGLTDLGGNARISGGTVDMGAYEFQFLDPFHSWLAQYGLPTDGSADYTDPDHDGMNNWKEWATGTNPTDPTSFLRLLSLAFRPWSVHLRWSGDTNHSYFVQRASSLTTPLSFNTIQAGIPGLPGVTSYIDTTSSLSPEGAFYRVGTTSSNGPPSFSLQPLSFIPAGMALTWSSVTNRVYFVERATNVASPPGFSLLQSNIPGLLDTTSIFDTNLPPSGSAYYRVGVQP